MVILAWKCIALSCSGCFVLWPSNVKHRTPIIKGLNLYQYSLQTKQTAIATSLVAILVPAMKREPPDDEEAAPWKSLRKRPRLPMPVDQSKMNQYMAKATVAKVGTNKDDALVLLKR